MIEEIWKDVVFEDNNKKYDFSGEYQISNFGRVKSFRVIKNGKIIKGFINDDGYNQVVFTINKKTQVFHVARLVGFHFIENPLQKPQINHIDKNRSNNVFTNLEWVTQSENQLHSFKNYDRHPLDKEKREEIIKKYKEGISREKLKKEYNVTNDTIKRLLLKENVEVRNLSQSKMKYVVNVDEVLKMIKDGFNNKKISIALNIPLQSVSKYKYKYFKKEK